MQRRWIIPLLGVAILGAALAAGLLWIVRSRMPTIAARLLLPPPLPPDVLYPPAPDMPAVVPETPEDLLARMEHIISDEAPGVLAALQPGLTDAEIDALESQHGFKLPPDLRALYRWRNGTPRDVWVDVFPNHRFVPLDEAVAARDLLRRQVEESTPFQQQAYAVYAGHRDAWLGLIVDAAGDGDYFDPGRSDDEGSFFFCFAEDNWYVFFPAFRNFLAAVIDGHESGVFRFGSHGAETVDFGQAEAIWRRYGAQNPR